jgi:predicted lipid carrier protein YhbT
MAPGPNAAQLAKLARRAPASLRRIATVPPFRALTVREIFRLMPTQLKPGPAVPDAVVEWRVTDDAGRVLSTWFLVLANGKCRTTQIAPAEKPRTTLTSTATDLFALATGADPPMGMFQAGRIKISGDLFFAAQLQGMFTIPA